MSIAYIRGIPVMPSTGSQGTIARILSELLGISVSRARAVISVARDESTTMDRIEKMITNEQAARAAAIARAIAIEKQRWHESPDGCWCCCTHEDRRYGMGCMSQRAWALGRRVASANLS